ncbi:hypothetical protein ASPSYDRAFT_90654 [Aspergillus sydowii CBS 593.65]|uniref:Uncharacterized protein n=1 Tax=Aspergillus sydowii CBS 593.65 TaxID=1036612 RepID=A0A1L9TD50_9EURO|nr:uncharacterized protein ASPSYDRAFT_90654 [Aspergillus sydowii CBS 593.65]OJJ57360.1 hypothetical protein ASPSYDRAFT_90654 [Aspergillus sydowii CBS 593.65]
MPSALQVTSAAWALVSLGHTLSAKDWQSSPQFRALPSNADTCARAGWYQGSVFFLVNALLNYNWSKSPEQLRNPVNKAIAVLMVAVMWASSGWYFKRGVTSNGVAVAVMGALQAYSSLRE